MCFIPRITHTMPLPQSLTISLTKRRALNCYSARSRVVLARFFDFVSSPPAWHGTMTKQKHCVPAQHIYRSRNATHSTKHDKDCNCSGLDQKVASNSLMSKSALKDNIVTWIQKMYWFNTILFCVTHCTLLKLSDTTLYNLMRL
jgi:hypothetical protein